MIDPALFSDPDIRPSAKHAQEARDYLGAVLHDLYSSRPVSDRVIAAVGLLIDERLRLIEYAIYENR